MTWGPWRTDQGMTIGDYIQIEGTHIHTGELKRREGMVGSTTENGFDFTNDYGGVILFLERWRLGKLPEAKTKQRRVLSELVS